MLVLVNDCHDIVMNPHPRDFGGWDFQATCSICQMKSRGNFDSQQFPVTNNCQITFRSGADGTVHGISFAKKINANKVLGNRSDCRCRQSSPRVCAKVLSRCKIAPTLGRTKLLPFTERWEISLTLYASGKPLYAHKRGILSITEAFLQPSGVWT